ncbi:MAG: protein trl [Candidatus Omnitrophica bacterium]|nr:protein trl [Candidatus Omnitrophota bacterium]
MKKRLAVLSAVVLTCCFVAGCATIYPVGMIYSEVAVPVAVGAADGTYSKVGTATSKSYLYMIAVGDSSIEAAAKAGGITKIQFVDHKVKNVLGFIGEYTTYVYGD